MARKKEQDRLSLESSAAIAAGMSYGKWKALQKPQETVEDKTLGIRRHCAFCGKAFYTTRAQKIYCDELCRDAMTLRKAKEKRAKEKEGGCNA